VLCFCQVAPKRLALLNSERFLAQAKFLWPTIKAIGKLNIPGPSSFLVSLLRLLQRRLPIPGLLCAAGAVLPGARRLRPALRLGLALGAAALEPVARLGPRPLSPELVT